MRLLKIRSTYLISLLIQCLIFPVLMTVISVSHAALRTDYQTWAIFNATGSLSKKEPKLNYWMEAQERFGDDSSRLHQSLIRPGLGYTLSTMTSIWLGYAWIYTKNLDSGRVNNENRIWQQLLWKKAIQQSLLTNRLRLEERFFNPKTNTAWRLRDQIKLFIPFTRAPQFSFISSDELFIHLNSFNNHNNKGFDQNRFFVGLGYKFNNNVNVETGYMNQYIRRVNTNNFMGNNWTLQLNLNY